MTDKFIPPPPSDEVLHRLDAGEREMFATEFSVGDCMRAGRMMREALAAAFAHDLPRVCRAEVEAALVELHAVNVKAMHEDCACSDCRRARLYLDARYGPAAGAAPAPEPVQTPPGVADVVALHRGANAPHLCDRPETLAFLRNMAKRQLLQQSVWTVADERQFTDECRAFLDATREAK